MYISPNAFPAPPCGAGRSAPLPGHSGNSRPAPTPDSAARAGRTRAAANPNRRKVRKSPLCGLDNVRGSIPAFFPFAPRLPPKNPDSGGLADAPRPGPEIPPPGDGDRGGKCYNPHSAIISPAPPSPAAPTADGRAAPSDNPTRRTPAGATPLPANWGRNESYAPPSGWFFFAVGLAAPSPETPP